MEKAVWTFYSSGDNTNDYAFSVSLLFITADLERMQAYKYKDAFHKVYECAQKAPELGNGGYCKYIL